jgi:hypothetical protein
MISRHHRVRPGAHLRCTRHILLRGRSPPCTPELGAVAALSGSVHTQWYIRRQRQLKCRHSSPTVIRMTPSHHNSSFTTIHLASALVAQTFARILLFVPSMALQSSESQSQTPDILLSVSCARLDFQVSAMAQICSGLSGTGTVSGAGLVHAILVLPVEEPMLGFHQSELSTRTCASASSPIPITHLRTTLT